MSFVRKSITVGGGQIGSLLFSIVTGVIFSRALLPEGMGQYELFRNVSILAGTLAVLGFGQAGIYFLNRRNASYEQVVSNAFRCGMVVGLVTFVALAVAIKVMPGYFGELGWVPIAIFSFGTATMALRNLLRPALVARLAARQLVVVDTSQFASLLVAGLAAVMLGSLSTSTAITLYGVSNVVSTAILIYYLRDGIKLSLPFDWGLFRDVLHYGLKLGAANLLLVLSGSLVVMMLRLFGSGEFESIGLYTRAAAVMNLVMLVPRAVSPMLYAKWAGAAREQIHLQVELVMRVNLAYGLATAIFLVFFGGFILWLLYGPAFVSAQNTLAILGIATAIFALLDPVIQFLAAMGQSGRVLQILIVSFVVLAGSLTPLVWRYGSEGAAIAVLVSNLAALIYAMAFSLREYGVRPLHCLVMSRADIRYFVAGAFGPRAGAAIVPAPLTSAAGAGGEVP